MKDSDGPGEDYANRWIEIIRRKARFGDVRSLAIRGALPDGLKDVGDCVKKDWASDAIIKAIEHATDVALPRSRDDRGRSGESDGRFEPFPGPGEMEDAFIDAEQSRDKEATHRVLHGRTEIA